MTVSSRSTAALIIVIVLLVAAALIIESFSRSTSDQQQAVRTPPPPPPLTAERTVEAIGTTQFAALVSYTDSGFEPASLSVHAGDTVRFVNNATHPLLLALNGLPDSHELPPGEYWEYTFEEAGQWSMLDAGGSASGSITVQ